MTARQIWLEGKPQYAARKSEHGDNQQELGEPGRKWKCEKWCCHQYEPAGRKIAPSDSGFQPARGCNIGSRSASRGEKDAYEERNDLYQRAKFHLRVFKAVTWMKPFVLNDLLDIIVDIARELCHWICKPQ